MTPEGPATAYRKRDVEASGIRLRVIDAGEGPPILLLHSLFFYNQTWQPLMDELGGNYRLIAPDLPGFGESEKPSVARFSYTVEGFTNAMADLYAGLGLGPTVCVGHGLGGAIAIALSARYPELVSRLILVDALCYPGRMAPPRRLALFPVLGSFLFKQLWSRTAFRAYFREYVFGSQSSVPVERIDEYYDVFNPPAARASAFATLRGTVDTRGVVADTARVVAPSLVIWGQQDAIYPAALGQRLSRDIRGAGFELMSAGHAPQEELPKDLAQRIRTFLR